MPWEVGSDVMPLLAFPADTQAELNALAGAANPPPRWKRLGSCKLPSRAYWEWHARRGKRVRGGLAQRGTLPRSMREAILDRDRGICQLCGGQVGPDFHIDHRYPVVLGGRTVPSNLQLAHPACNLRKGAVA